MHVPVSIPSFFFLSEVGSVHSVEFGFFFFRKAFQQEEKKKEKRKKCPLSAKNVWGVHMLFFFFFVCVCVCGGVGGLVVKLCFVAVVSSPRKA